MKSAALKVIASMVIGAGVLSSQTSAETIFQDTFSRPDSQVLGCPGIGGCWTEENELFVPVPGGPARQFTVVNPADIQLEGGALTFHYADPQQGYLISHANARAYAALSRGVFGSSLEFDFTPSPYALPNGGRVSHIVGLMTGSDGFDLPPAGCLPSDYCRSYPVRGLGIAVSRSSYGYANSSVTLLRFDGVANVTNFGTYYLPFQFELGSTYHFAMTIENDMAIVSISNGVQSGTVPVPLSGFGFLQDAVFVLDEQDGNDGLSFDNIQVYAPDVIAPTASPTQAPAANGAGWNNTDVTVTWNWTDNAGGSGIDNTNCATSSVSSGEGSTLNLSATCADLEGNTGSAYYAVKVDKTKPTLSPVVSPNPVLLNGSATANPNAADATSLVAMASCGLPDTSSVGTKSVSCSATDNAGNTQTASTSYQVIFSWSGFYQPVDNLPTLNSVKAGSAIPIKFGLGGDQGLSIFAAGYPISRSVVCVSGAPTDEVEVTTTAGSSSLSYDPVSGQYNYVWKTDKTWAGTCRQLVVKLVDGTEHLASFKFK